MPDVVSSATRSQMMAGIRGKNTAPELLLRCLLHKQGFRFRIHYSKLPGRPDIVLPKYKAVVRIHGCFWHGHDCHLFKWPSTRPDFWRTKIESNRSRDRANLTSLEELGWRVLTIWECALKGKKRLPFEDLAAKIVNWLTQNSPSFSIDSNASTS